MVADREQNCFTAAFRSFTVVIMILIRLLLLRLHVCVFLSFLGFCRNSGGGPACIFI